MSDNAQTTIIEQEQRLDLVKLLVPHFGRNVNELIEAATSIQEYLSGIRRSPPSSIGDTE